jgi:hypothetical protein
MPEAAAVQASLEFLQEIKVISADEAGLVTAMFEPDFAFSDALSIAESIHVQVKTDDLEKLPHERIRGQGLAAERTAPRFQKYAFTSGLAAIFTTGPIAEEDLIPGAVTRTLPFVDHFGIDLREDSDRSRDIYSAIPAVASSAGWRHVQQGGQQGDQANPVRGCYCEVSEKSWVYPPDGPSGVGRPIEFAYGELEIVGQDDRPPLTAAHRCCRRDGAHLRWPPPSCSRSMERRGGHARAVRLVRRSAGQLGSLGARTRRGSFRRVLRRSRLR